MNIYRYKNYDFEKQILPLGFEWKTATNICIRTTDRYMIILLYNDEDYLISFLKEKYIINAEAGSDYVYIITAKINLKYSKRCYNITTRY